MGDKVENADVKQDELVKSLDAEIQALQAALKGDSISKSQDDEGEVQKAEGEEPNEEDEIDKADSAYWEGRKNGGRGVFDQGRTGSRANRSNRQFGRSVRDVGIGGSGDMQKGQTLAEHIAEQGGDEAASAMNVSEFLYGLTKAIDTVLIETAEILQGDIREVRKSVQGLKGMQKTLDLHSRLLVAQGNLNKSMSDAVHKVGEDIVPSMSLIKSAQPRFNLPNNPTTLEEATLEKSNVIEKAVKARLDGKIDEVKLSKIEERLNHNEALEDSWLQEIGITE